MDLEEEMEKKRIDRSSNRQRKILNYYLLCIMYADDILLLIKREAKLKEIIKRFRRFFKRKGLGLSPEKSKVMVFEKRRKRIKRELKMEIKMERRKHRRS